MTFLPHTFSHAGYEVTVNADRSIKVRADDWLSKYSAAIYQDFRHIKVFKEKVGGQYRDVPNPDLIRVGATLYHPGRLPGEPSQPAIIIDVPGSPELPLYAKNIVYFLKWLNGKFIDSGWRLVNSSGFDVSYGVPSFSAESFEVVDLRSGLEPVPHTLYAAAFGATLGWPRCISPGFAMSYGDMPQAGHIMRSPHLPRLRIEDFQHGIVILSVGANFVYVVGGGALTIMLFGILVPATHVVRQLERFFQEGDPAILARLFATALPSGFMVMLGSTLGIPGAAVSGRAGAMYDRAPWKTW